MKIKILTLFPELFSPFLEWSMIKKARSIDALSLDIKNLRDWGLDKRGTVDDTPYGGGPGMILKPEPIYNALEEIKDNNSHTILLSPKGEKFNQKLAYTLSQKKDIILICGHYEDVDQRVREHMIDQEISIGDYVLSGGEIPAMVIVDSVSRLLPGVLEKEGAADIESFSPQLAKMHGEKTDIDYLEFPQYTKPSDFKGWKVPDVLLSGDHAKIEEWKSKNIKPKKNDA